MKAIISVCLLCLLAFCAVPARAGKLPGPFPWGLGIAEVLATVSADFAPEVRGATLYFNPGAAFGGDSRAKLRFGDNGLVQARYEIQPDKTEALLAPIEFLRLFNLLKAQYDEPSLKPDDKPHPNAETYYWETATEIVTLTAHGGRNALTLAVLVFTAKPVK